MNMTHSFDVVPNSEAEEYIVKEFTPLCKDNIICQLGDLFGRDFNRYIISHRDYKTIKATEVYKTLTGKDDLSGLEKLAFGGLLTIGVLLTGMTALVWKKLFDFEKNGRF